MKKNKFKFYHTFVIPTVNKSQYLEFCLKSLKKQKIKSNIIITTAKPFVGIRKFAKKYNVKLIIFNKHKNIANDWNRAIRSSKSNYVTIAHQDDIYNKNYLYEVKKSLRKINNKKPAIIFTDYYELKNNKKNISLKLLIKRLILFIFYYKKNLIHKKNIKKKFVSFGSPISCPSVTFNNQYNIRFDEKFWINIDWNLWINLSETNGSFLYIKKKLVGHRIHNKSETSRAIKDGKREKEDWILFNKLWPKPIAFILCKLYKLSYKN
tara:strand:- start:212 stop:1006 length:795 start_codon:yes stop_codon:yes gene_type:complete